MCSASLVSVSPGSPEKSPIRESSVTLAGTCRGDIAWIRYWRGRLRRLEVLSPLLGRAPRWYREQEVPVVRFGVLRTLGSCRLRASGRGRPGASRATRVRAGRRALGHAG